MIAYAFFHVKKSFWAQSNSFLEVLIISPLSKSQSMIWFVGKSGVKYGKLVKMSLNHLKLFKNDRVCLLSRKKSFWASQTHFCKFSEFHPCLSSNPWFGLWGSLVWNMVIFKMALNHLKLCKNDRVCLLSWKKSFWASQTHCCKFSEFSPLCKSQSMILFVGKSGVKYGNLSKWL